MNKKLKSQLSFYGQLAILSPLLPFYLLILMGDGIKAATEWLVTDRKWSGWLVRKADNFELWMLS